MLTEEVTEGKYKVISPILCSKYMAELISACKVHIRLYLHGIWNCLSTDISDTCIILPPISIKHHCDSPNIKREYFHGPIGKYLGKNVYLSQQRRSKDFSRLPHTELCLAIEEELINQTVWKRPCRILGSPYPQQGQYYFDIVSGWIIVVLEHHLLAVFEL